MTKIKRTQQTLFGIPIFSWDSWDIAGCDELQFYDVIFSSTLQSMQKYNGCDCTLDLGGLLTVTKLVEKIDKDFWKAEVVWKSFVCKIPEFVEELNKKYNSKNN